MAKETAIKDLSYEKAFEEMTAIVARLEEDNQSLEEAVKLFERGQALAKYCAELLDQADLKVQQLTEDGELNELE
ncbi:MAG: exodeoxyribonuclease VII small subunit [Chloroflexi bacterium]|nr:exodeoxyribonuclease VII small subunit [Chloroflexota bacterium]